MDYAIETVDGDIVLKFKNFLVEEGGGVKLVSVVLRTSSMHFLTQLARDMDRTVAKQLLSLAQERCLHRRQLGMIC